MELGELVKKMCEIFQIENTEKLPDALMKCVKNEEVEKYEQFCSVVQDLSVDWLQKVFQYYHADRKEKMQDYTPQSLASFMAKLIGEADVITDLCAGSGALTIQKWNVNHEQKFELFEFDKNVIPFLLFNMAVRNIECTVYHFDVLQLELYHKYKIRKGERFGRFKEV